MSGTVGGVVRGTMGGVIRGTVGGVMRSTVVGVMRGTVGGVLPTTSKLSNAPPTNLKINRVWSLNAFKLGA